MSSFMVNVALRANYADSSYFDSNESVEDKSVYDHVLKTLSAWFNARTKSKPVEYQLYLWFYATYSDGRKADLGTGWKSYESVNEALDFVEKQVKEHTRTLRKIGEDDI